MVKLLEDKRLRTKTSEAVLQVLWDLHVPHGKTVACGAIAKSFLYALAFHLEFDFRTSDEFVIYMNEILRPRSAAPMAAPRDRSGSMLQREAAPSPPSGSPSSSFQRPASMMYGSDSPPLPEAVPALQDLQFQVELAALKGWFGHVNSRHASQSESPPHLAGWLWKRGRINTNWKHRYCTLDAAVLSYFREKGDRKPAGAVRITESIINSVDSSTQAAPSKARWLFSVWTPDRIYYFASPDKEVIVEWMKNLLLHTPPPPREVLNPFPSVSAGSGVSSLSAQAAARTRSSSGSLIRRQSAPGHGDVDEFDLFELAEAHIELCSLQHCAEMMNGKQEDLSIPFHPYQYESDPTG